MKSRHLLVSIICVLALLMLASCTESTPEAKALPVSYELSGGHNPDGAPSEDEAEETETEDEEESELCQGLVC